MTAVYENIIDVGDEIPGFTLDSQLGSIFFREIIDGKWALLVTFGKTNDPVSTTDLAMLAKLMEEFQQRNIFVIALGSDTGKTMHISVMIIFCGVANMLYLWYLVPAYRTWIKDIDDLQTVSLNFALLSDPPCAVLRMVSFDKYFMTLWDKIWIWYWLLL